MCLVTKFGLIKDGVEVMLIMILTFILSIFHFIVRLRKQSSVPNLTHPVLARYNRQLIKF